MKLTRLTACLGILPAIFITALSLPAADIAQPDLRIGKRLGKQKGNDSFSTRAAGQKIRSKTNPRGNGKFFFSVQNDSGFTGDIRVKARRGNRKLKTKYKQTKPSGGNVTGAITRNGLLLEDLAPDGIVSFKAIVKTKRQFRDRGARRTFLIQALEPDNNADPDRGKAKVIKKP